MNSPEWALVAFTVLAQMSVGSFIVLGVVHAVARSRAGERQADRLADIALLAIGPALVLGMGASLLHLGSPLNAPGAVANVASSWLSREILFGVLFAMSGGLFALLQARKLGPSTLRQAIALAAAALGLGLVYSMSNVYMLPSQPAWNTWATPAGFFATTFLLGSLAIGAALVANYWIVRAKDPTCAEAQCTLLKSALKGIAIGSIALLGVEFVIVPLALAQVASGSEAGAASVGMMVGEYGPLFAARLALVFLGAGVFGALLYRTTRDQSVGQMGLLACSAFALVLASEVLGRFLFYATHVRIGI